MKIERRTPEPAALAIRSAELEVPAAPAWRDVLAVYLRTLESPRTRSLYARAVGEAFAWWGVRSPADLSGPALVAYRSMLLEDGRGPATHALALAALRSFLRWAGRRGAHSVPRDVIDAELKSPRAVVLRPFQTLTELEVGAMLAAATTPRDRALLAVLLGAGLRVAEVVALDVADVLEDAEGGAALHVRRGKGRRDRVVPIRLEVVQAIRAYLADTGRTLATPGPLFRAHDRGAVRRDRARLSVRAVAYQVHRTATAAGIAGKAISPHSLRHSYALRALRTRRDVVGVSKLLGHANVATSQRYVDHLHLAELRDMVPALPMPPGRG